MFCGGRRTCSCLLGLRSDKLYIHFMFSWQIIHTLTHTRACIHRNTYLQLCLVQYLFLSSDTQRNLPGDPAVVAHGQSQVRAISRTCHLASSQLPYPSPPTRCGGDESQLRELRALQDQQDSFLMPSAGQLSHFSGCSPWPEQVFSAAAPSLQPNTMYPGRASVISVSAYAGGYQTLSLPSVRSQVRKSNQPQGCG